MCEFSANVACDKRINRYKTRNEENTKLNVTVEDRAILLYFVLAIFFKDTATYLTRTRTMAKFYLPSVIQCMNWIPKNWYRPIVEPDLEIRARPLSLFFLSSTFHLVPSTTVRGQDDTIECPANQARSMRSETASVQSLATIFVRCVRSSHRRPLKENLFINMYFVYTLYYPFRDIQAALPG